MIQLKYRQQNNFVRIIYYSCEQAPLVRLCTD